ncbi:hypothetical protein EDC96DRAFT_446175, partial [Choanephora cucurbitarum]
CNSFASDGKYIVKASNNCASACSCPYTSKRCDYVLLTSRVLSIPPSLHVSLVEPTCADECFQTNYDNLEYFQSV